MADQIKLETVGLGEILASITTLRSDVQTTREGVSKVITGLEWEVGSKEQINSQLEKAIRELKEQEQRLDTMEVAVREAITQADSFNADITKLAAAILTYIIAVASSVFTSSNNGVVQNLTKMRDWLHSVDEIPVAYPPTDNVESNRGHGSMAESKLDVFFEQNKGKNFARKASGGIGCAAFARTAWKEMYGINGFTGTCSISEIALNDSNTIMNNISVGDVIRIESGTGGVHWFVVKGWDESGITVYQSEGIDNGKLNKVLESTYPWSGGTGINSSIANFFNTEKKLSKDAKFIIHHANNYS